MNDKIVDARGLNCPMPILRTKKALKEIAIGDTLEVLASDPGSLSDFEAFARQTGDELVSAERLDSHFRYVLRRKN
ncbi:sulfurtransferase TusA family protein [Methylocystis parvus]|uniref:Sulfurtransferase TusA family protein n=1 Tax=Methylocystis parvus TaxID=134 RepID=A0A6B8MAF4_9HYPH|nr:sulfurtransferase TusA family protein [Methylocystis parvus]QGM98732.1 sulfurtransferase TusA family protein [Methylocystis parvus]WBK00918.1 sulfurtransferase TusA family protein [Methylocystis parvus OBBP]